MGEAVESAVPIVGGTALRRKESPPLRRERMVPLVGVVLVKLSLLEPPRGIVSPRRWRKDC